MVRFQPIAWSIVAAVLIATPVSADSIVFDSFGPGRTFGEGGTFFGFEAGEEGDPDSRFSRAFPFVPSVTSRLRTVELPLFFPCCDSIPGDGSVVVNIFASDGNLPGRLLESFVRSDAAEFGIVSLSSSLRPLLLAGATYFIETTTIGITAGIWFDSPGRTGPFVDVRRRDNGAWEIGSRSFTAAFRITGDEVAAVPEPSSVLLFGTGLAAAALRRRRRNRVIRQSGSPASSPRHRAA